MGCSSSVLKLVRQPSWKMNCVSYVPRDSRCIAAPCSGIITERLHRRTMIREEYVCSGRICIGRGRRAFFSKGITMAEACKPSTSLMQVDYITFLGVTGLTKPNLSLPAGGETPDEATDNTTHRIAQTQSTRRKGNFTWLPQPRAHTAQ